MSDRAQEIGLFRWRVISEAVDASLSARERGALVRALAAREHLEPGRVSRRLRIEDDLSSGLETLHGCHDLGSTPKS